MGRIKDPYNRGLKDGLKYAGSKMIAEIYAAFVITLKEDCRLDDETIETILCNTQVIWNECVMNGANMAQMAKEKTGIDVICLTGIETL